MHKEILSESQLRLLPLVSKFRKEFYLAGGTAVALYIGHRRSIDFDLFKFSPLNHRKIVTVFEESGTPYAVNLRIPEQLNLNVTDVKFTFLEYPFTINAKIRFEDSLRLPELIDLAAMKAYALGRRSKWKDYVDLYFLIKEFYTVGQISERAREIFDQLFSEKLFRAQLSYFDDVDYTEEIEYLVAPVSAGKIKEFLVDKATDLGF
ncbi:MAG: nucleotidyl transferase AbiEii/AbiGii toxin family protein [Bacteroidales bacterium]